jgi:two-component system, OmpR family, phosphate regulon sensor histidine kinase PhoR
VNGFGRLDRKDMMSYRLPLTPEILVPRMGDYLVEKGHISADNLRSALAEQGTLRNSGEPPPLLGQILISMGVISREKLDEAITEQIMQLREALQRNNQQLEMRVKERTLELEQALEKLSELNKMKVNFVSNISHELRTPLTHVKGYLELIINKSLGTVNDEQLDALNVVQRATDRLEQLIESLILFSTSEREEFNLQFKLFNLSESCNKVASRLTDKVKTGEINLQMKFAPDLPLIEADQEKIEWAILQLLDNAVKFTPPGGKVLLKCEKEGKVVRISIMDTGIGIPKNKFDELFAPFHQLDGSTTRRFGGTGLGLALVKKIIEAHGSYVHVKSEEGKGSKFEFLLNSAQYSKST